MARALDHHHRRFALTNELHARPFVPVEAPGRVVMLAFKEPRRAQERDPDADRAHLEAFIDRFGGAHPAPDADHYLADLGRFTMKWERHTEFVSYTLIERGAVDTLFDAALSEHFPEEWLAAAPGKVVAAVEVEVLRVEDFETARAMLSEGPVARAFSQESLAIARTIDECALAAGDFRIHEDGFSRFVLLVHAEAGSRRVGRAVQRLIDIENYRSLSMLGLPIARAVSYRLNEIDRELSQLIATVAQRETPISEEAILDELTALSAEIESLAAQTAFRFGAARAYEAIVHERIAMMRETRMYGRQLFSEFMVRRYDPAIRTVKAAETRLSGMATRASRVADLLRTRVDVTLEAQNQKLLVSMNRRAALQLRLQETVEGFSVVAISYYAVSLSSYVVTPLVANLPWSKEAALAAMTLPIVLIVSLFVRSIRRRATSPDG